MRGRELLLCIFAIAAKVDTAAHSGNEDHSVQPTHMWNYDKLGGPANWNRMYEDECGDERPRQSPVAIDPAHVTYEEMDEIDIVTSGTQTHSMQLLNNGHSAKVNINGEVFIEGGELGDQYQIVQLHFHWGSNDNQGSEHTLAGKQYPLEMHILGFDAERHASLAEALNGFNSLAVLGIFFEVEDEDNPIFAPIIDNLEKVTEPETGPVHIDWIDPSKLLPEHRGQFYRYDGSLTTPTCLENVIWTVFDSRQHISRAQMQRFRELFQNGDNGNIPMVDNFRSPQPLKHRKVYASFKPKELLDREENEKETANFSPSFTASVPIIISIIICLLIR